MCISSFLIVPSLLSLIRELNKLFSLLLLSLFVFPNKPPLLLLSFFSWFNGPNIVLTPLFSWFEKIFLLFCPNKLLLLLFSPNNPLFLSSNKEPLRFSSFESALFSFSLSVNKVFNLLSLNNPFFICWSSFLSSLDILVWLLFNSTELLFKPNAPSLFWLLLLLPNNPPWLLVLNISFLFIFNPPNNAFARFSDSFDNSFSPFRGNKLVWFGWVDIGLLIPNNGFCWLISSLLLLFPNKILLVLGLLFVLNKTFPFVSFANNPPPLLSLFEFSENKGKENGDPFFLLFSFLK